MHSYIYSCIHTFIHAFIHSFKYSIMHFLYLFKCSYIHASIHWITFWPLTTMDPLSSRVFAFAYPIGIPLSSQQNSLTDNFMTFNNIWEWRNIFKKLTFHNRLVCTHKGHHLQMNLDNLFSSIKIMFDAKIELTKWHNFVVWKFSCFAKCERWLCPMFVKFPRVWPKFQFQFYDLPKT